MHDYEKLGSFYLGKEYDLDAGKRADALVLYDSKDLVTHAICVGMTGSGKTGLCIGLLEEAAIDGIPALIIDPKGDLANLLLQFPNLQASDFRPWINESDAQTKGMTPDQFASQQAEAWRKGLESWGMSGERINRLRAAADVLVYTPGSSAGVQLSILKSFDAPGMEVVEDAELFRDRVNASVSGLLGLIGVQADPARSREHVLLSNILTHAWAAGESLDLAGLIARVQQPPFARVGVLEVEAFFPSKDRFELAMQLNNLLASPQFASWTQGQALDVGKMLYTDSGKPRLAIVSIAHLGDAERMFFVSLLLSNMLAWVRAQSGTTSLRALLYMDEIAGYVPPVANPPSKQSLLTLMKQARAFGVGVVLATQNPVDIDYKGLSNAGTWFIGRLQTEQDKARLLDGLQSAMGESGRALDRSTLDRTLSRLGKRVFFMHNVHEDGPVVFETRWAMSYLRGPLTRQQIKQLMDPIKAAGAGLPSRVATAPASHASPTASIGAAAVASTAIAGVGGAAAASATAHAATSAASARPVLPPDVPSYFVPVRGVAPAGATLRYEPSLLGFAAVRYKDAKTGVDLDQAASMITRFEDGPVPIDWDHGEATDLTHKDVEREPSGGATFGPLHPLATKAKSYADWQKRLADAVFRTHTLEIFRSPSMEAPSQPGESEKDFRIRMAQLAREQRDALADKLRAKYAPKIATLHERVRKAQQALEVQEAQSRQSKVSSALSFGAAVLGGFLGRKVVSAGNVGKAASAMKSAGRAMQESGDVKRAEDNLASAQQQLAELEAQFQGEVDALATKLDPATEELHKLTLRPKKTDVRIDALVLAWRPHWADANGNLTPAWE
jgi:hypothetical protein